MSLHVLDTDTLSLFRRGHTGVTVRVRSRPPEDIAVSVITIEEQLGGWYALLRKATRREQVELAYRELGRAVHDLAAFQFLDYTGAAMAQFEVLTRMKLNVGKNDLRVAAIALEHGAVVVTRNIRDFARVPGLLVEDWAAP